MYTNIILYFFDTELFDEKEKHDRLLYIKVQCNDYHISFVLTDNGSMLNVYSLQTSGKISIDSNNFIRTIGTVKASESTNREILGEIDLEIVISQIKFEVTFQVVDIKTTFILILRRS
jgi:NDP-sugar pyrophosphorylase family protein